MLRFRLLGFDVVVHPLFWLILVFLGAGNQPINSDTLSNLAIFGLVATFSILVHELGHAWVGTRLGGGSCTIILWAMGGLAAYEGTSFKRSSHFWSIFAGPAAGFALLFASITTLCLVSGPSNGLHLTSTILFGTPFPQTQDLGILETYPKLINLFHDLIWINFWWNVINLVPIPPLDGGQISLLFLRERPAHIVALICCILLILWAFSTQRLFSILIFAYLAYQSILRLRNPGQHPPTSF